MPILRSMTKSDKEDELDREYFDNKFDDFKSSQESLINESLSKLKLELYNEFKKLIEKQKHEIETLKADKAVLQNHVNSLKNCNEYLVKKCEDIEQYGRRLCLRVDGVEVEKDESADKVLDKVKDYCNEAEVPMPEWALDRAHRIGPEYKDKVSKKSCKSIIVKFTNFHQRTRFFRARHKIKSGVKVKVDLTKERYNLLKRANAYVKNISSTVFCYADVNCRLKVRLSDDNHKFFNNFEELEVLAGNI